MLIQDELKTTLSLSDDQHVFVKLNSPEIPMPYNNIVSLPEKATPSSISAKC